MSFLNTLDISASGLTAQRFRMDIIAQNIANIDTTRTEEGGPYQRRLVVFEERQSNKFQSALERAASRVSGSTGGLGTNNSGGVRVQQVVRSENEFVPTYNPSHPDADEDGYVLMPNVDRAEENIDLMAATHSYNSNITALNVIKAMAMKAAEITK